MNRSSTYLDSIICDRVQVYIHNRPGSINLYCLSYSHFNEVKTRIARTERLLIPGLDRSTFEFLNNEGWNIYEGDPFPCRIVVCDELHFPALMRVLDPWFRAGCTVIPANTSWVVPNSLRDADAVFCAWETSAVANYVARCNLKGHYLEFGTFWGRSFFKNFYELRHWLNGEFYAFDSFEGLSTPCIEETVATAGDFTQGAYCANQKSFRAIADLLAIPRERIRVIQGFFSETLRAGVRGHYKLSNESVSVCYIDCDLYEPTKLVLDFVAPLLEPGALIYFDDWRLCRASRQFGERAAALDWLQSNKHFELVEFHRDLWQHQWFIFQKN